MKSLKVAKMNLRGITKPIVVFYIIIIAITTFIGFMNMIDSGSVTQSGFEMTSVIFLFICGLNSFKENYYFAKASNISRKSFMSGIIISVLPITLVMTSVDMIINRVTNIFLKSPTMYDMSFGSLRGVMGWIGETNWVQSNSFESLIGTFIFQLTMCIVAYILGVVISMIYYRCNKLMKVVISVTPVLFLMIWNQIAFYNADIVGNIVRFFNSILGVSNGNVIAPITTFIVISMVLVLGSFMLIRNSVIKEK